MRSTMKNWVLGVFLLPAVALAQPGAQCYNPDWDADGEIGVTDLLGVLGVFGEWKGECAWPDPTPEPQPCLDAPTVRYQGHDYPTVALGGRCWFTENLRAERYANGEGIPSGLSSADWLSTLDGAMATYAEGTGRVYSGSEDATANLAAYGRLYNWFAVDDWRGLCPVGWAVPSADDWDQIASDLEWSSFRPLYGGGRNYGGFFGSAESSGMWWSSSPTGPHAIYYRADRGTPGLNSGKTNRKMGASIRCIRLPVGE